jgi:hypothetical protein
MKVGAIAAEMIVMAAAYRPLMISSFEDREQRFASSSGVAESPTEHRFEGPAYAAPAPEACQGMVGRLLVHHVA